MAQGTIDPGLQAAVEKLLGGQAAAWRRGDANAFAEGAAPDIVFTNVVGMLIVGRDDFVAQHQRAFGSVYKDTSVRHSIEHVAVIGADTVLVNAYVRVDGVDQPPPGVVPIDGVIHLRVAQLLARRDGIWRIAAYTNIAVRPGVAQAG